MFNGATIVFDLDGTLVDTAPDLTNALNHALKLHGHPPVDTATVREAAGRGAPAMIYEALGLEIALEDILADFLAFYEANIAVDSRPFPGALALLERLKARGAQLAVCTNKRAHLANLLLAELEIGQHFDAIAGRDSFAAYKPHPDHLLGTIAACGGSPERAVMVGDSTVDIQAAQGAGVPAILVTFGYCPPPPDGPKPDATVGSFESLEREAEILLKCLTDQRQTRS